MNINDIATKANGLKKINKASCFELVKHLIRLDDAPNESDLIDLYNYFLPAIPKKPKTVQQWIAKAMPKNDVRYYLNNLHVKNRKLVATDGYRVHMTDTSLEDGFYNSEMTPIVVDGKYPDINRIIPDIKNCTKSKMPTSGFQINEGSIISYCLFDDIHCQKKYIDDALSGMNNPDFYYTDKTSPVLIQDADRTAIVMHVRL